MGHDEQFNKIISRRFSNNKISLQTDFVAVERPLELTMSTSDGYSENLAILMRTPGDDKKLILGFLFSEGILSAKELKDVKCEISENKINLILESNQLPDFSEMKRNFISNSSCGICGKEAISEILKKIPKSKNSIETNIAGKVIQKICTKMKGEQNLFLKTGGFMLLVYLQKLVK